VEIITTIIGPGINGLILLNKNINIIPSNPINKVNICISLKWLIDKKIILKIFSERWMSIPKICFTCEKPIINAAADVKPLTTGWDMKFVKKPSLRIPINNCIIPTRVANKITR